MKCKFHIRVRINLRKRSLVRILDKDYPVMFLLIFIFLFVSSYTFSANIHDDGANNAVLAKEIVKSQKLLSHMPYKIAEIMNGNITYYPISYGQFSHLFMSFFFLFGGEIGFKLFSPLLATINAVFVYVLLQRINRTVALLGCILTSIIGSYRFVFMTPLMEQYLLPVSIASVCLYALYISSKERVYAILAGLFLGITFVIKQQGALFAIVVLFIIFLIQLHSFIHLKKMSELKIFIIILFFFTISSVVPTLEQIERNGTINFVPSDSVLIPFLRPKYFINQEAVDMVAKWLGSGYWFKYNSPLQAFKAYLLYPLFYYRSPVAEHYISFSILKGEPIIEWLIVLFTFTLLLLGMIYIFKKSIRIGLVLFSAFLLEVFSLYLTNTPIHAYHVIGIAILSIFWSSGIYYLSKLMLKRKILIPLLVLISFILSASLINSYVTFIHKPIFGNSGRVDDKHLKALNNLSLFVEANIPKDAIILGPDGLYRYWISRDFFWWSDMGGIDIFTVLTSEDEEVTFKILKQYNISYVFIDNDQVKRRGCGDYMPSKGLLSIIDKSIHFKKIYDDGVLRLYEVVGIAKEGQADTGMKVGDNYVRRSFIEEVTGILPFITFVLFLPGFILSRVFFPGKTEMNWIERMALSFGLSITVIPLLVFDLNFLFGVKINMQNIIIVSTMVTIIGYLGYLERMKRFLRRKIKAMLTRRKKEG